MPTILFIMGWREVKKIIFEYFEYIEKEWKKLKGEK
jgi:hypothetical protein